MAVATIRLLDTCIAWVQVVEWETTTSVVGS